MKIEELVSKFNVKGEFAYSTGNDNGLINATYIITTKEGGKPYKYVLQKINHNTFKQVDKLMENIKMVTEHARKRVLERGGDVDRECLNLVLTKDDKLYYYDQEGDGYYRMYKFIHNATAPETMQSPEDFYSCAYAFGSFAQMLSTFEPQMLHETIPNFHNTKVRYQTFEKAIENDVCDRVKEVQKEIEFIRARKDYASKIVDLLDNGQIPVRVTHNDTRLNNIMMDDITGKAVVVIDLDTVMAGSVLYDFGDSIRSGCNPRGDDEKDLNKVVFNVQLFEQYVKGYLEALKGTITQTEKENLLWGAIVITYEQGIRFLTDYLEGDVYFKTTHRYQNLIRTRAQLKMVADMEAKFDELEQIVKKYM